jgi:tetratricopeptide (TPR) repeat protein
MAKSKQSARLQRNLQQTMKVAVRHHTAGRLQKAEALYGQILQADPENPVALHLLGVVAFQTGDDERADALIAEAIALKPDYADAHGNLGNVLQRMGRLDEALASFHKAVVLTPDVAEAHNNVGSALKALGRLEDAAASYHMAVALRPDFAEAYSNYGAVLHDLGRRNEALACFRQAVALRPVYAEAHANLAGLLRDLGHADEAAECYRRALAIDPGNASTQANLAGLYLSAFDDEGRAVAESCKGLDLLRRQEFGAAPDETSIARLSQKGLRAFRLKHDLQQADYLAANGHAVAGLDEFRAAARTMLAHAGNAAIERVMPDRDEARALLPYLQAGYTLPMPALSAALNPENDWAAIQQQYLGSAKEIIHIDEFLSPEALKAFQAFSLVSKLWLKDYPNKYLGAFSDQGFISPLHIRLARELQQKMPKVFGGHAIGRFWGFKYDAALGKGINVHADFARVNLNFWITPDEHNLEPGTGGLKVYDVPSPRDWHFKAYNENKERIYAFLDANKAISVNVPYRCNRAVLFNSAYFHETDRIRFAEGYESRRINVTYLFGTR